MVFKLARISYLTRRGSSYYARMKVPAELAAVVGRNELTKALGTKDENEAKRRLWPVIEGWRTQLDDVSRRRTLTDDDRAAAPWAHYEGTLDRDDASRAARPTPDKIDAATRSLFANAGTIDASDPLAMLDATIEVKAMHSAGALDAKLRQAKAADLRKHLVSGELALVRHEIDEFALKHDLIIPRGSPEEADIGRRMIRAEIEALERTFERDRGDYGGTPRDPIVKPATTQVRERAKPGETVPELFEAYARDNPKGIAADTLNQARRDISTFLDLHGRTLPVRRIDRKAIREWKALLREYPVKATETKAFAGMGFAQIIRANKEVGKPVITPRTVNRYLASMGAFCQWLVINGYLDANPTADMSLPKSKSRTTRPFTTEELKTLFASPLFTGCQSADEWRDMAKPGNIRIDDHRYWLPLVMLYSGARPAEIAQLEIADVRQQHGHWIMHITTEGGNGKSVKTDGSMRVVPVHSELVRLGFIAYRDRMAAEGQTRLFPEAKRNSRGQMIAEFSREFGRYLERIELKKGRGLSLYSFRHGVADALRRAGRLDEEFGFILGHVKGSMTGRYGQLPQGMLEQRVALIESIVYERLDLN
ncbi:DUF6538 domain-containing protein [Aurantimonas sp. 22II-16-19i]|uniref:DUF6538 domain-containing protein n=1 Tax=Aurantimonas sp. 22II-16-19i TaxID=1317114 RepID=UPI0009F7F221|nr:DUF6538 domain-containing protein [Aurantimonas sp. 22II-16-19i]ORE90141.1 phage integrase [Aurantimonas sp. 22II-16-19i]